jgi:hypothetical protein
MVTLTSSGRASCGSGKVNGLIESLATIHPSADGGVWDITGLKQEAP